MDKEFWSSFTHDPRDAQFRAIRAADQDRAIVLQALTEAYADGRLNRDEFDERSERTNQTRTLGELSPIVADLVSTVSPARTGSWLAAATPAELHQRAVDAYVTDRREAVFWFLVATLVCTVIWLASTGPGHFPWPIFVAVGTGISVGKTILRKQEIVDGHERRLEKKRARELGHPWRPNDKASE